MQGCWNLEGLHIVPWKDATSEERLDTENGILLSPDVDALFDGHMISFEDDGRMVVGLEAFRAYEAWNRQQHSNTCDCRYGPISSFSREALSHLSTMGMSR